MLDKNIFKWYHVEESKRNEFISPYVNIKKEKNMWVINSDNTEAINSDSLTRMSVMAVDADMNYMMVEDEEIVGYGVFSGLKMIAGPYVSKTNAQNQMLTIISKIGRIDIYYCPPGDYDTNEHN